MHSTKWRAGFLLRNVKSALLSVIICRQKYEEAKSSIQVDQLNIQVTLQK